MDNKTIYLDYAATTPVKPEVLAEMLPYYNEKFGNPSSLYSKGQETKNALNIAREKVASIIGATPKEIFFTSSGTEADNWAVIEGARWKKDKGNHIITSQIEHHAVLYSAKYLEKQGFDVTYLPVNEEGLVNPKDLEDAIREDTILVSIMLANNEIGTIQPIAELAAIAHAKGILFHTDAVQALGNIKVDVGELGVDMMSISGHKIYAPKGVGALYIKKGIRLPAMLHGGAQESNRRASTENVAGIVAFGKATELAKDNLDEYASKLTSLRDYFLAQVKDRIPDIRINGSLENRLPGNVNITFKYIEGEAIMLLMDMKGILVSTGSACSSASLSPSHVLDAIGVPVEEIHGSIRFSFGDFTTKEDVDATLDILEETIVKLRNISPVSEKAGF